MIMTPETWQVLVRAIASIQGLPPWLKEQAQLSWEAVSQFPTVDATTEGQHSLPTVEQKFVNADYLDFLREQIRLNARGPEWLALLKGRLAALEPFVGKELLLATFHSKPHSATLRIHPKTRAVVHVEVI
jgi:hypothetical protein